MTNTMIERVARAILKSRWYDCEPDMYASLETFFDEIDEEHIDQARQDARAAVEAMRELDESMIMVGIEDHGWGDCEMSEMLFRWQAMIDAAKAEGQPE
jgi:hypothetical protein